VQIPDGDYPDLAGAALVMITAGNERKERRGDQSQRSGRPAQAARVECAIYRQILPEIFKTVRKRSSSS